MNICLVEHVTFVIAEGQAKGADDARLQRSFANHGFFPAAYAPAMVFHGTHRLDVVKMLKLNVPYNPASMMLTDSAQTVVSIVENGLK